MEAKLIRTEVAEFKKGEYSENTSGFNPIGDRVLIKVDESAEKTSGGVFLPDETVYKQTMAAETGVIIAVGDAAFKWTFDRTREWYGVQPKIGDRVYIERYAGRILKGKDSVFYRILDDKCVAAIEA